MDSSLTFEPLKLLYGGFVMILSVSPLIAVIWLFAWIKDIRSDTREIKAVLKRRFPDDFEKE